MQEKTAHLQSPHGKEVETPGARLSPSKTKRDLVAKSAFLMVMYGHTYLDHLRGLNVVACKALELLYEEVSMCTQPESNFSG